MVENYFAARSRPKSAKCNAAFSDTEEPPYDFILMDIQMPRMDGYEATRRIRRLKPKYAKRVPIIAMTANAFAEDKKTAIEAGMDAHVAKPIDVSELIKNMASFVKK